MWDNLVEYWNGIAPDSFLYHALVAALILFVSTVLAWLSRRIADALHDIFFVKTATTLDDQVVKILAPRLRWVIFVGGLRYALREFGKGIPPEMRWAEYTEYLTEAVYVLFVILLVRVLTKLVALLLESQLDNISRRLESDLHALAPLSRKLSTLVIVLVAAMIVLDHFSINIGSLIVSLGVGSLAVALAAQDTLANIIAGFIIAIDRPFRVGDRVELPNGKVGDVNQIGMRSTKILDFDYNLVVIANADLVKSQIINYGYPAREVRVLFAFSVAYGTDISQVREIVNRLFAAYPGMLPEPKPETYFMKFGDSGIELRGEGRVDDFKKKFDAETSLREQVYTALTAAGIEMPFPQRVFHLSPAAQTLFGNTLNTPSAAQPDKDVKTGNGKNPDALP